jgi:hypothetical protein
MPSSKRRVTFEQVTEMAVAFPGVEATSSFGTPALKVKGKFMARLREPDVMVLKPIEDDEQQFLMGTQPDVFFLTDHYRGYPAILIRLSKADPQDMRELLEQSWRRLAPKKLLDAHDGTTGAHSRSRKRRADRLTG